MKNFTLTTQLFLAVFLPFLGFSQENKKLFDSSWYGFQTGQYPGGLSPSNVKSADLDNDGDADLALSQENFSNGFVVLMNKKRGIYGPAVKYNSTHASKDLVIADLNNDGWKDVALTNIGVNSNGNKAAVYINKGNGTFKKAVYYTVGLAPVGIDAADLDNDGDIDLAVANYLANKGTVSILANKGDGTFKAAINFPSGLDPFKISVANLDNDNLPDIVVANVGQRMNILFNGGNNNFSNKIEMTVQSEVWAGDGQANVETADMDNDGDKDILYSSSHTWNGIDRGQIAYFKNQGNGTFSPLQTIDLAVNSGGAIEMDVADFDNNGWPDILAANFSGRTTDGYQVVLNDEGSFSVPEIKPAGQSTYSVVGADVNNDNKPDVITSDWYSLQVTVHINEGKAKFPVPALYMTNNGVPGSLDAADIDGDGDLDLVSSASTIAATGVTVTVQKNNGDGSFTEGVAYSIRGGGVQAKFRDLNGDEKPDLIFATDISSPPYDFHTAINKGDGTFGKIKTWSMDACGWSDIDAVDLDNDGDRDAVILERLGCIDVPNSAKRIFICKNDGDGNFGAPLIKVVNPAPSCVAAGDFNEDGNIDLVTGQPEFIDLHLGTGTGNLQAPLSFETQQSPFDLVADDFNNDGHLDVAACTESNFEGMSVLLGNGNGSFQPAQNYRGAYSPDLRNESGITSGDVDGDGDIDIMVGNGASHDVSIYFNNGDGTFDFKMRYGMYYHVASSVYADFSGDGKGDIAALVGIPPSGITGAIALLRGKAEIMLPVQLISFTGTLKDNNVLLQWIVSAETNTRLFEIEKSEDGKIYKNIGMVAAVQKITHYNFVDKATIAENNFYRLKFVSGDNKSTYSNVVLLRNTATKQNIFVKNNPFTNYIDIEFRKAVTGKVVIQLTDLAGKQIAITELNGIASSIHRFNLSSKTINNGMYILNVKTTEEKFTAKVMKQ